jgi:hypothetical protein
LGGAIYTHLQTVSNILRLERTIIAHGASGAAVHEAGPRHPVILCTDVFGNAGGDWVSGIGPFLGENGNFSADPLFCGPESENFTLQSNSPCAPPGVTSCGLVGALPVGCGPISTVASTWARIKSKYRK